MALKFQKFRTRRKELYKWFKSHFELWFASLKKSIWIPLRRELKARTKKLIAWFKAPFEIWFTALIGVAFITFLILGPVLRIITIYPGDTLDQPNRLYLLSAAAQSLAAILALVVTMSLVAVQLASQMFTPHVMRLKLRDFYFWLLIGIYLVTILWTLWVMGWLRWLDWFPTHDRWAMDVCLLLIATSLSFLAPYVYETIKGLKPEVLAQRLLNRHETGAVEETLHRAVTEGFITLVGEVASLVDFYTIKEMVKAPTETRLEIAQKTARCYMHVAKRAVRQKERDSFATIFRHLTGLTRSCTELTFRDEADIFNDTITELYDFAQEEEE